MGPLLNTRQPKISGQQNSQRFLRYHYLYRQILQALVFYENSWIFTETFDMMFEIWIIFFEKRIKFQSNKC